MADSVSELKSSVKCDGLKNLYYIYGKDIISVETAYKFLCSSAVKKGDEVYNMHTFDGRYFNIDEFTDACEALPMFADYVLCAVNDLNAEDMKSDDLNWLVKFITDLPETTIVVFYYTGIDITGGKKTLTVKNKKISDAVAKHGGKIYNFEHKTPDILAKEIMSKFTKYGSSISKENALLIVHQCCSDTLIIKNETDKLLAYCGKNEITEKDIMALCPRQMDAKTYDLANAVVRREKFRAINIMNDLKMEMTEPISILYAVTGSMLDMYRAKIASGSRRTAGDVLNDFKYQKNLSFRVNNAFRDVRYYSVRDLRKCLKILTETDVAMKSTKTDNMILLEEAIVKMLSLK